MLMLAIRFLRGKGDRKGARLCMFSFSPLTCGPILLALGRVLRRDPKGYEEVIIVMGITPEGKHHAEREVSSTNRTALK